MKIKRFIEMCKVVCCACGALGFWGVLYPELVMTGDICYAEKTESLQMEMVHDENYPNNTTYWKLLEAGPEEITFRCKFLERLGVVSYEEEDSCEEVYNYEE